MQTIAHVGMLRVVLDISEYDHTTVPMGACPEGVITVVLVHAMSPMVTITAAPACPVSMGTPHAGCCPDCGRG